MSLCRLRYTGKGIYHPYSYENINLFLFLKLELKVQVGGAAVVTTQSRLSMQ
jgi:hypothetical protein